MKIKKLAQLLCAVTPLLFTSLVVNATESQKIKLTQDIEILTADQQYDSTHDLNFYSLYMLDETFNTSDQYIDAVASAAKNMTDVDFMKLFSKEKLSNEQKKPFENYIYEARKENGFDLSSRINLIVKFDNWRTQEKMKASGINVPPKPDNFREFDIDQYYNQKFDGYFLIISQMFRYNLSENEQADLINSAGVMSNASLIKMVESTHFKKKLRHLISQEIKERTMSDKEKAYIVFWCQLLGTNTGSNS